MGMFLWCLRHKHDSCQAGEEGGAVGLGGAVWGLCIIVYSVHSFVLHLAQK